MMGPTITRTAIPPSNRDTVPDHLARVLAAWATERDRVAPRRPGEQVAQVQIPGATLLFLTGADVDELRRLLLGP